MRLIDADALRVAMYHEAFENDASYDEKNPLAKWDSGLWVRYKMFESCLESAPSIDAVKHGRWISCSSSEHYKCSCCGTRASFWFDEENSSGWQMDMSEWLSDYCPNCGAKMDETVDEKLTNS